MSYISFIMITHVVWKLIFSRNPENVVLTAASEWDKVGKCQGSCLFTNLCLGNIIV